MTFRILLLLHLLGIVVWVGGMFFAHFALRPATAQLLDGPTRLRLMHKALGFFFTWVEWSIVLVLASGIGMMMILGGTRGMFSTPPYIHLMFTTGLVMMAIFGHIRFAAYKRLGAAVEVSDWPGGAAALAQIRLLVSINLFLGLLTVAAAALGPGLMAL